MGDEGGRECDLDGFVVVGRHCRCVEESVGGE
jgi:hypothetical protein